jgi:amino acid adenylation domain-containing protein
MPELADAPWNQIAEFNRTERAFPDDVTLHEWFERLVQPSGAHPALICHHDPTWGGAMLTFAQLNDRANQLARRLQQHGVGPGDIVGLLVERSFAMVIGLFGILKAGAAYLPLSPDDPADRLGYVLTDAAVKILLVQRATASRAPAGWPTLDLESPATYSGPTTNLGRTSQPDDLAYVIYTSGSTGRPKGVMIEHRSIVNRLDWMQRAYPIGPGDVLLQKTPYCFDVSVWELFWWSITGATLSILPPRVERSPLLILEIARRDRVTVMHFVPSMLNVFLEYLDGRPDKVRASLGSLRRVFASGEALSPAHVQKFNAAIGQFTACRLTNLYGPTEATVDATYYDCPAGGALDRVPIGRPIQNMKAYVLRGTEPVELGETGELCLAGVGLARGYLNNVELTREKFPGDVIMPGERIYRTGDLARWLPDGNLEYLGREDHQVKIRGLRIELEEIENCLRRFPGLVDVVVVARKYSESIHLIIAYCVAPTPLDVGELKRNLAQQLPDYMVPDRFEQIAAIPLTLSGKADRKALPDPVLRPATA